MQRMWAREANDVLQELCRPFVGYQQAKKRRLYRLKASRTTRDKVHMNSKHGPISEILTAVYCLGLGHFMSIMLAMLCFALLAYALPTYSTLNPSEQRQRQEDTTKLEYIHETTENKPKMYSYHNTSLS